MNTRTAATHTLVKLSRRYQCGLAGAMVAAATGNIRNLWQPTGKLAKASDAVCSPTTTETDRDGSQESDSISSPVTEQIIIRSALHFSNHKVVRDQNDGNASHRRGSLPLHVVPRRYAGTRCGSRVRV